MARSFIQPGDTLTLTAPSALAAGDGFLVGAIVAIAAHAAANGAAVEGMVTGVHSVTKAGTQAWTVGAKIYWDNTAKVFTNVATANTLAGVAVEAVAGGAGDTTGKIRLNGSF